MVESTPIRNADVPWDHLDPELYRNVNYSKLREDDRQILTLLSQHFVSREDTVRPPARGVDFGTGSNLYPALAMLPFCSEITLIDRSAKSLGWLRSQTAAAQRDWDPFWLSLASSPRYAALKQPWRALAETTVAVQRDVLEPMPQGWGMGTMMFVAESITGDLHEFTLAIKNFLGALLPGAPFAMAFMAESDGYWVANQRFPAVPVGKREIHEAVAGAADYELVDIPIPQEGALREGYEGMILALGSTLVTSWV